MESRHPTLGETRRCRFPYPPSKTAPADRAAPMLFRSRSSKFQLGGYLKLFGAVQSAAHHRGVNCDDCCRWQPESRAHVTPSLYTRQYHHRAKFIRRKTPLNAPSRDRAIQFSRPSSRTIGRRYHDRQCQRQAPTTKQLRQIIYRTQER